MREIKFRGWSENMGMSRPFEIWSAENILKSIIYNGGSTKDFPIVMQFTGLKDKNGTGIYEGDIMEWTTQRSVVEWDDYGCFSIAFQSSAGAEVLPEILGNIAKHAVVIGNIYQNKELLK